MDHARDDGGDHGDGDGVAGLTAGVSERRGGLEVFGEALEAQEFASGQVADALVLHKRGESERFFALCAARSFAYLSARDVSSVTTCAAHSAPLVSLPFAQCSKASGMVNRRHPDITSGSDAPSVSR